MMKLVEIWLHQQMNHFMFVVENGKKLWRGFETQKKCIQKDTQQPNFSRYIVNMVPCEDLQRWEFNIYGGRLKSREGFLSLGFKSQGLWGTFKVLQTQIFLKPPYHNSNVEELQPSTLQHVFA